MDPIYVQFDIPERDLLTYEQAAQEEAEKGDGSWSLMQAPLAVGLETETGYPHAGVISFRDNRVDNETGTAYLRGSLPNADRKLIPGLFCRVQVPVGEPKPRLLVPETALAADQAGRFVLVVNKDDTVEQRRVEIESGMGKRGFLSIAKGVTASDRIIVSGIQKGRPGSKVAPEFASATGTTSVPSATPATGTTAPAAETATKPSAETSGANPSGVTAGDAKSGETNSGDNAAPANGGKG
jgi:RND family efflux transporter MFP subunit